MKKVLVILISIMFSASMLFGQGGEFDSRLLVKYSVEELNVIEKENPSEIRFLTYCLDNAFYIGDYPTEKDGKIKLDGEKQISNINEINLYELKIEILEGKNQLFSVNGKSKLLIIYDSSFLKDKFNKANK
jgi:hypothetical protein